MTPWRSRIFTSLKAACQLSLDKKCLVCERNAIKSYTYYRASDWNWCFTVNVVHFRSTRYCWNKIYAHRLQTLEDPVTADIKVKVSVYSVISMLASIFSRFFTRRHGAATRAHPAHVDSTLDSCTRYPSLLGGQRHYRMRNLPKAPTHDQYRELNPRTLNLRSSALPTGPRDHTYIPVFFPPFFLPSIVI